MKKVARQLDVNPVDRIVAAVSELARRLPDEPKYLGSSPRSLLYSAGDILTSAILDAFAGDVDPLLLICGAELDPSPLRRTLMACERWYRTDQNRLMLFLGRHVDPKFSERRVDLSEAKDARDAAILLIVGTGALRPRKPGESDDAYEKRVRRAFIRKNSDDDYRKTTGTRRRLR